MALPAFAAGDILTAADLQTLQSRSVVKVATESVTSSTTLQNDDELVLSLPANTTWEFETLIFYDGDITNGDLACAYTFPAGATVSVGGVGPANNVTSGIGSGEWTGYPGDATSPTATFFGYGTIAAGTWLTILHSGVIVLAGAAGSLQFQWAQRASSATAVRVAAGSRIVARRTA